jgi:hypothetical protein
VSALTPLSEQELRFLADREFLTAKHHIQQVLRRQLEQAQQLLQQNQHSFGLPDALWEVPPKISRGENYEQLPYLVLDYPRVFQQQDVFAYRSMIWWGQEISCSLHLSGSYWQHYKRGLLEKLNAHSHPTKWWLCVHTSPWEYHFRPDNYRPLSELLQQEEESLDAFARKPFFKISRRLPLERYADLPAFCLESLKELALLLA